MVIVLSTDSAPNRLVFMRFRPTWVYIDGIREFCRFFCETTFGDGDIADRVQLVIQELLENAVKYSADKSVCDVEFSIEADAQSFAIAVRNYPSPDAAEKLKAELSLQSSMGAEEAYAFALRRAATLEAGAGRMGLARLRLEGGMNLSILTEPDGRLTVTATGDIS